ncbi:hypothetical protein BKA61DRAFT_493237 [Leptodontidium sp. MPI-SDFR-AT-0119]|nr:hypothetical protein BKA61DRAFT_493237 [Leptodontidium sp. MPI-SDFR-AT-0119]
MSRALILAENEDGAESPSVRGRRTYIERDSQGRERLVLGRVPRLTQRNLTRDYTPTSSADLLEDAENREQTLVAEISSLRAQLSMAQRDQWHLQNLRTEHERVVNEHHQCRDSRAQLETQVREVKRMEDMLMDEEERNAKLELMKEMLEEKVRLFKRAGSGEGWQRRYEEKLLEVEVLRQRIVEKDDVLKLAETRILERNSTIVYLKNYLRTHGFRIDDGYEPQAPDKSPLPAASLGTKTYASESLTGLLRMDAILKRQRSSTDTCSALSKSEFEYDLCSL